MEKKNGGMAKTSGVSCTGCSMVHSMPMEMETGAKETKDGDLDKRLQ